MANQIRHSNIELLRIIIMFMILLLHANFFTFGRPEDHSFTSLLRCFAEAFTITPVNIFVLITGFFGTSFSLKKVFGLIYQVFFCVVPLSIILVSCGIVKFDYHYFVIHKYWFINAYVGLLILTPILNAAVEKLSKKDFLVFFSCFYVLAFLGVQFGLNGIEMVGGYSIIWFVFLYMLGRYLRLYTPLFSKCQLLLILFVSCLCQALVSFYLHRSDYVQPFILIQSVSTLLLFAKFDISYNKTINTIAASVTMAYLVDLHPAFFPKIQEWLLSFYEKYSVPVFLLYTVLLCVGVFMFAIIYDQLRIFSWKKMSMVASKTKATN